MDLIVVLVLVIAAVLIGAVWYSMQRRKTRDLQGRFGPEYEAAVNRTGDRGRAEADLERRIHRVERFHIKPLAEHDRQRYVELWHRNQAHFVDDPGGAVEEADKLVCDVMKARGYPMAEFDHRAEDLSVDHPHVVRNYRAAHAIAERHGRGEADTEDLRRAVVYYRDLFAELLEANTVREEAHR